VSFQFRAHDVRGGEWDDLKNAIGELEDIVGRPSSEDEICSFKR
jgi:hypothetical protein